MGVFIDTSYFFARLVAGDQWYESATKASPPELAVTSSLVIHETISLLQWIRSRPGVRILYPDAVLQAEARDQFARWGAGGSNAAGFEILERGG